MKTEITWKSNYSFLANARKHSMQMDAGTAAGGRDEGPTPKELVLAAICGCSGMDIVGLLKKSRIELSSLKISAEAETVRDHPRIFNKVVLIFEAGGEAAASDALVDAVQKSQTIYCGVSAMISRACDIFYRIYLNGQLLHEGQASFPKTEP